MSTAPSPRPTQAAGLFRRAALLAACIAVGAVVGLVGRALTGSDRWFLAIPLAVAVGWLFVADPTRCRAAGTDSCAAGVGRRDDARGSAGPAAAKDR